MKQKILDFHTHIYPENIAQKAGEALGKFYNFTVGCRGTYSDLEAQADLIDKNECELAGFLIFSVATNPHQVEKVNDIVAQTVKKSVENGFETIGFAGMHQDFPDYEGEIERISRLGLKGIKIHPDIQRVDIDSPQMFRLCEIIEGRMPICFHTGDEREEYRYSSPKKLARLCDRFPSLTVIAPHMGGYRSWDEAEYYLYGRKNIYYDISSTLWAVSPEFALSLIEKCGKDRVFFGTDYPILPLRKYLDLFMQIEMDDKTRADILYNNAKKFIDKYL